MAKKVRFPLEMDNGEQVRSVEELREHFSVSKVISYVQNGKLSTWLRDRYADELADAVECLDLNDAQLPKRVSEIFDVPYEEMDVDSLEAEIERNRRLEILKGYTSEEKFVNAVDGMAFEQDDVYDLLDEGKDTIYLCGERFSIPLSKKDVRYIGVNKPVIVIDSKEAVDWEAKGISFENVRFDEKYQHIEDSAIKDFGDKKKNQAVYTKQNWPKYRWRKNSYFLRGGEVAILDENGAIIETFHSFGGVASYNDVLYYVSGDDSMSSLFGHPNVCLNPCVYSYDLNSGEKKKLDKMESVDNHLLDCVAASDRWIVAAEFIDLVTPNDMLIMNIESGVVRRCTLQNATSPCDYIVIGDNLYYTVKTACNYIGVLNLNSLEMPNEFEIMESGCIVCGGFATDGSNLILFWNHIDGGNMSLIIYDCEKKAIKSSTRVEYDSGYDSRQLIYHNGFIYYNAFVKGLGTDSVMAMNAETMEEEKLGELETDICCYQFAVHKDLLWYTRKRSANDKTNDKTIMEQRFVLKG